MNKIILLFFTLQLYVSVYAQTMDDVYAASEVVWFGVDYSKIKLAGGQYSELDKIRDYYFPQWNYRAIDYIESNYKGKIQDKELIYDNGAAIARSSLVNPQELLWLGPRPGPLLEQELQEIVNLCNSPENQSGVGLILVANYFTYKGADSGSFSAIYFDIASKKIIQIEEYVGDGAGVMFLTIWDKPLYNSIKQVQSDFVYRSYKMQLRKQARQESK